MTPYIKHFGDSEVIINAEQAASAADLSKEDINFTQGLKEFAEHAIRRWFRHATGKDIQDPKIYEMVRNRIALNFKSTCAVRQQTGELTY